MLEHLNANDLMNGPIYSVRQWPKNSNPTLNMANIVKHGHHSRHIEYVITAHFSVIFAYIIIQFKGLFGCLALLWPLIFKNTPVYVISCETSGDMVNLTKFWPWLARHLWWKIEFCQLLINVWYVVKKPVTYYACSWSGELQGLEIVSSRLNIFTIKCCQRSEHAPQRNCRFGITFSKTFIKLGVSWGSINVISALYKSETLWLCN